MTLAENEREAESVVEGMSKVESMVEGVVPKTVSVVKGVTSPVNEFVPGV